MQFLELLGPVFVDAHSPNIQQKEFSATASYHINGHTVDFARNQISKGGVTQSIEPKVMEVLKYFLQHPNSVIDQEALFAAVWPQRIFSQSLVQRAIAILRKALGDNATTQTVFMTHPKKGYSFVAHVEPLRQESKAYKRGIHVLFACASITLLVLGWILWSPSSSVKLDFATVRPLTSSPLGSHHASFSPDGLHSAYLQDTPQGLQQIWLVHLESGRKTIISKNTQPISSISWSTDGNKIAYISQAGGAENRAELGVMTLNKAKTSVQSKEVILILKDVTFVSQVAWSQGDKWFFIVWRASGDLPSKLYQFDITTEQRVTLLETTYANRFHAAKLSPDQQHLAIAHYSQPQNFELGLLSLQSKEYQLLHKSMSQQFEVNWHPNSEQLLLTTEHGSMYLDMNRRISTVQLPEYQQIADVAINPSGSALSYTQIRIDADIFTFKAPYIDPEALVNSIALDFAPRYSPNGQSVAYLSKRAGYWQVFTHNEETETLVYHNPTKLDILGPPVWSPDGDRIVVAQNQQLVFIDVESGVVETTHLAHENMFIYDWYAGENALLTGFLSKDGVQATKLDLNDVSLEYLEANRLGGFSLTEDDNLILSFDDAIYINQQRLDLDFITPQSKFVGFRQSGHTLFIQTRAEQGCTIWRYDLVAQTSERLMDIPNPHWRLEDATKDGSSMLFTSEFSTKKNIMLVK